MTNEERILIAKLNTGELDGVVGDLLRTSGGSTVWTSIKGGMPVRFKQGPGGKFFGGKENERFEGASHNGKVGHRRRTSRIPTEIWLSYE